MLLGQIVAISVACNLFFTLLSVTEPKRGARLYARPTLWLSVLASLVTVAISPYTDETTFLPNLLVMHVLLIIPLATDSVTTAKDAGRLCLSIDSLYTLIMLAGFLLRVRTTQRDHTSLDGLIATMVEFRAQIGQTIKWQTFS